MTKLLANGRLQGEACDRLEGVADTLEAWAEAANNIYRFGVVTEEAGEAAKNQRDNYAALASAIREAVRDINNRPAHESRPPCIGSGCPIDRTYGECDAAGTCLVTGGEV